MENWSFWAERERKGGWCTVRLWGLFEDKEGRKGAGSVVSRSRSPLGEAEEPGAVVTPSQSRTSPGSLGVGSSYGARPAAAAHPRPGPGTHPRGLLSRTCQQTPVDGRHLRLQL